MTWGVGGVLDQDGRTKMNSYILKLIFYDDVRTTFNIDINMENW